MYMEEKIINRLPSRTWNFLGVNEASIAWDEASADVQEVPPVTAQESTLVLTSGSQFSRRTVHVAASAGEKMTLLETVRTSGTMHAVTELTASDGAQIELIQLLMPDENACVYSEINGQCIGSGRIVLRQVMLGHGDVYAGTNITLDGAQSSFQAEIGYLAKKNQMLDMNLVVEHRGQKTKSEINVSGALDDAAKKIFRGTIDLKRGASGAVGSEQETVLMLGEDAVNKTVPVILCAEENVEGTHGASIGEMDDETRFYFESRGIDRQTAERLMSRASVERVARLVTMDEAKTAILNELDEVTEAYDGLQG
jgi:Fe-S cluster assembly protein SufD